MWNYRVFSNYPPVASSGAYSLRFASPEQAEAVAFFVEESARPEVTQARLLKVIVRSAGRGGCRAGLRAGASGRTRSTATSGHVDG